MLSQLRGELTTCTKCSNVHCCCCCNSSLSETATSLCHISASSLTCVVSCLQCQMSKEKKSCKEINLELKMGSSCPTTTEGLLFQNWNYWTETLLEGRRTDGCLFTFTYCHRVKCLLDCWFQNSALFQHRQNDVFNHLTSFNMIVLVNPTWPYSVSFTGIYKPDVLSESHHSIQAERL